MTSSPPPLSVVVATTQPWPELRMLLESLAPQVRALGAEVIVADGHGRGVPDDHGFPNLRVVRRPGASVYQLRAHRTYPRAAAIGGVVHNGADDNLWDWASFLISNGTLLPPLPPGDRPDISGQANLSYKRWALPSNVRRATARASSPAPSCASRPTGAWPSSRGSSSC